jgi:hypothetical protein
VQVLTDGGLRKSFRAEAMQRAEQLSLASTTGKVEQLYEEVVEHPHPDRNERFLLVKELIKYYVNRMSDGFALGSESAAAK